MIGRFETGGPHVPCRENGSCEEKTRPFPTLTWMKRTGNMHRVSLGGRYGRPRGKRQREASRQRRNATLSDYGVTQDRTTMNTLRRLCGTMPPTHVPHPPISFAVQLLHRNGPYLRVFSKGKTLDRAQERSRSPWFSVLRVCLRVSVVGRFYARCRYCNLASPGMLYIVRAV